MRSSQVKEVIYGQYLILTAFYKGKGGEGRGGGGLRLQEDEGKEEEKKQ